jgi:hypothetical protein
MFECLKGNNPMDGRKVITKGTDRYTDWFLPEEYEGKQIRVEAKCWRDTIERCTILVHCRS